MSSGDDGWGWVGLAVIAAAGWWLWNNYEVRERQAELPIIPAPSPSFARPAGDLYVTTLESGTVWSVDADELRGPRDRRMVWTKADHSKDKSVKVRETKTLYEVNCDRGSYVVRTILEYDANGNAAASWRDEEFSDSADFAPPGSNIAAVLVRACDARFDDATEPPKIIVP